MALQGGREEPDYEVSHSGGGRWKNYPPRLKKKKKSARLAGSLLSLDAMRVGRWDGADLRRRRVWRGCREMTEAIPCQALPPGSRLKPQWVIPFRPGGLVSKGQRGDGVAGSLGARPFLS